MGGKESKGVVRCDPRLRSDFRLFTALLSLLSLLIILKVSIISRGLKWQIIVLGLLWQVLGWLREINQFLTALTFLTFF
jgi:hypothetical protein